MKYGNTMADSESRGWSADHIKSSTLLMGPSFTWQQEIPINEIDRVNGGRSRGKGCRYASVRFSRISYTKSDRIDSFSSWRDSQVTAVLKWSEHTPPFC